MRSSIPVEANGRRIRRREPTHSSEFRGQGDSYALTGEGDNPARAVRNVTEVDRWNIYAPRWKAARRQAALRWRVPVRAQEKGASCEEVRRMPAHFLTKTRDFRTLVRLWSQRIANSRFFRVADFACNSLNLWWPGTELNRRRQPFQGCALPMLCC
jgi:hypothetical protein